MYIKQDIIYILFSISMQKLIMSTYIWTAIGLLVCKLPFHFFCPLFLVDLKAYIVYLLYTL